MNWHLIEGEEGCRYAREEQCAAVVVDALRASATAAMLLHHGATRVTLVQEVGDALRARRDCPDALLYGERGGLPPEGFDYGNSPAQAQHAAGRPAILTTTTGTARVIQCKGARAVLMGSTVNAMAVVSATTRYECDVVLIPAGRGSDSAFGSQEDWAAAAAIATASGAPIGEGALYYREWRQRLELDGLAKLFETAPHAENLVRLGFAKDVLFCARQNVTRAVPVATGAESCGIVMENVHE